MSEPARSFVVETPLHRGVVSVDVKELLQAKFPERLMLLSPWLMSQYLTMIHAWRGIGKTYFALWLAYALACGGKFLGWKAEKPVKVLYLDGEMPGGALCERVAKIIESFDEEAAPGWLRFVTPDLQPNGVMPNLSDPEGQAAIDAILGDAQVIIVDNLSCLARGGKENEAESWHPIATWALKQRAAGRSVVFIHHSGKGGLQRGTSKREDLLDVVISLRRPSDYTPDQGARFVIEFEKARNLQGSDVATVEATLTTDEHGKQTWASRAVEETTDAQILELAKLGLPQSDIARELGCHRSTVLRSLRKAEADGKYKFPASPKRGSA